MTDSDTEHNEDADIEISEKIEENGCIEQLGYDHFIRLCILFTSEAVLHGERQSPSAADLQHALDFLDGKTTAAALDSRRDSAWRDHDKPTQRPRRSRQKAHPHLPLPQPAARHRRKRAARQL